VGPLLRWRNQSVEIVGLLFHRVTTFGSPATSYKRSVALRTRLTTGLPLSSGASGATPCLNGRGVNSAKSAVVHTVDHYYHLCQEVLRLFLENRLFVRYIAYCREIAAMRLLLSGFVMV
jgi:hypothetical protein